MPNMAYAEYPVLLCSFIEVIVYIIHYSFMVLLSMSRSWIQSCLNTCTRMVTTLTFISAIDGSCWTSNEVCNNVMSCFCSI